MTGKELLERWQNTGLLEGIDSLDRKFAVATCIQAQINLNQSESEKDTDSQWKRVSIPAVRRIFASTRNLFVNEDFDNLNEHKANYQILKTKYNLGDCTVDGQHSLQKEAEGLAKFCDAVVLELNEMFRDIPRKQLAFYGFKPTEAGFMICF